jgi:pyrroloquinoline quinone biosynthesis protein B
MLSNFKIVFTFFLSLLFFVEIKNQTAQPYILVLGIAQDDSYPHLGCEKNCCNMAWKSDSLKRSVVSLELIEGQQL